MPPRKKKSNSRNQSPKKVDLPPDILEQLTEAWENAAEKKDSLPLKQVKKLMSQTLELLVHSSEFPKKETIKREEFMALAGKKLIQKEKANRAFGLLEGGKGVVVVEDLQQVASELGEEWSLEELQEMVNEVDQSGAGLLTNEDFVKIAHKVKL